MSISFSLFVISGFLGVVLLLEGAYLLWTETMNPEVKRVQRRLRLMSIGEHGASDVTLLKQRVMSHSPFVNKHLLKWPVLHQLDRLLLQSGSSMTVAHLLIVCFLCGFGGFLLSEVWRLPHTGALIVGAVLAVLPLVRLPWMRSRRLNQIGMQLPDALDLISRALRAGHGFSAALAMVGNEAKEPIATEFRTTFDEINFGISTQNALGNLATRVPFADLRYFVVAVLIQLETGGNLAQLLSMLANLIRDRFKLFGRIRVLAAEGKLSAYILTALPFLLAFAIHVVNPGYLAVMLIDPLGIRLVIGALCLMVLGGFVMWRIIDIQV